MYELPKREAVALINGNAIKEQINRREHIGEHIDSDFRSQGYDEGEFFALQEPHGLLSMGVRDLLSMGVWDFFMLLLCRLRRRALLRKAHP